jgi:hypothetical protein
MERSERDAVMHGAPLARAGRRAGDGAESSRGDVDSTSPRFLWSGW